jgi:hypothetical protein
VNGIDRQSAAAEAALDRIDDGPGNPGSDGRVDMGDGMHIETEPPELGGDDDSDDEGTPPEVDHAELVDGIVEAFNAHDVDAISELCAGDCETPGLASDIDDLAGSLDDLWERRPTITMTRVIDEDGVALGVLWERGETAGWAPLGLCHVDVDRNGMAAVLEFSDDVGLLDRLELEPPDGELEEGATWAEWDEGVDGL